MTLVRAALSALAVLLIGCGSQHAPVESPAASRQALTTRSPSASTQLVENARRLQLLLAQAGSLQRLVGTSDSDFRVVGMDEGPVPDFNLLTPAGVQYNSKSLVGKEPFVAVFFATWCEYCQGELSVMQRALHEIGPMPVIPVSVDTPDTWDKVPSYLQKFGIKAPAVYAHTYPKFAAAYDPFDTVPLVVIVGRSGGLVDCLPGYDPTQNERLVSSLRLAKTQGPMPTQLLSADNAAF
jgi:thiol-disulfide isomerase/thioredoxin